jgi:hypothetical protein
VRSLIKLNAIITSRLPAGTAIKKVNRFHCFYEAILASYRENLVPLGGESCSSSREVTVAFSCVRTVVALFVSRQILTNTFYCHLHSSPWKAMKSKEIIGMRVTKYYDFLAAQFTVHHRSNEQNSMH